jgi:hypothetical protein
MGRKQNIDEKLIAEKILDFESTSSDSGGMTWESVSAEVFPSKKKRMTVYWWYAGVAAIMLVALLIYLPQQGDFIESEGFRGVAAVKSQAETDVNQKDSQLSELQQQDSNELIALIVKPESKYNGQNKEEVPVTRAAEFLHSKETTSNPVSKSAETEISEVLLETDKLQVSFEIVNDRVPKPAVIKTENVSEEQLMAKAEGNLEVLSGKKITLLIETEPVKGHNEKKGLIRRVANFNRTGEWEKTEKDAEVWAKIVESTKPDKRVIVL